MASQGIHLLGSGLAVFGWMGVLLACIIPTWRVTSFVGATIVTSQVVWEGIWMTCVVQSTGQMQCDPYDSMLALSSDLKAAQVLTVGSLLTGSLGLILAFIGGKCTRFLDHGGESTKHRVGSAAGVILIISALLCLIPVMWATIAVVQIFYDPQIIDAQRREIGSSIYIGWGASILLLLGGGMFCSTSCCHKANDNSLAVDYRLAHSSGGGSSIKRLRQVQVQDAGQTRKASFQRSDGDPNNREQHQTTFEGTKQSKTTTTSEEPLLESEPSDGPSTKSQQNYADSEHNLSSKSEAVSACPGKTYI